MAAGLSSEVPIATHQRQTNMMASGQFAEGQAWPAPWEQNAGFKASVAADGQRSVCLYRAAQSSSVLWGPFLDSDSKSIRFSSVQLFSCVQHFTTPWTTACQASLSITNSQSLLKLMSIELVMPSNHLILCRPLLFPPSIFPSIRVFSKESVLCIRWPKYWNFSFSISPSNEYSGLISFRRNWLDLLAVQGTCKSLLQYHSSQASILWYSAFFIVQCLHPYMTTGKTIALTRWILVGKVMSLLFNMLCRFVIAFLPGSKCLLISWLQSPSAVILEPKKRKSTTVSTFSPSICHEVMGSDAMILGFWMLSFKPCFSFSSFILIERLFSSSSLFAIGWCHLHVRGCWYSSRQSWFQLESHPAQHFT